MAVGSVDCGRDGCSVVVVACEEGGAETPMGGEWLVTDAEDISWTCERASVGEPSCVGAGMTGAGFSGATPTSGVPGVPDEPAMLE